MRYRGVRSQPQASVSCRAIHSAVGCAVTPSSAIWSEPRLRLAPSYPRAPRPRPALWSRALRRGLGGCVRPTIGRRSRLLSVRRGGLLGPRLATTTLSAAGLAADGDRRLFRLLSFVCSAARLPFRSLHLRTDSLRSACLGGKKFFTVPLPLIVSNYNISGRSGYRILRIMEVLQRGPGPSAVVRKIDA